MKSFLRLFLLASVLLLLLGLFKGQQSDTMVDYSEAIRLDQVAVLSGNLSLYPVYASLQTIAKSYLSKGFLENLHQGEETRQSGLLSTELQASKRIMREISPDLLRRTGYFIYVNSCSEIPS